MLNFEEGKRKMVNNLPLKNAFGSNSHNSLMSALDKKRSDVSKDKYIGCHLGSRITSCPKAVISSIRRAALSSILDKLRITKTTRTCKLAAKSIKNFFKLNWSKNHRLHSLPSENRSTSTFKAFYRIRS